MIDHGPGIPPEPDTDGSVILAQCRCVGTPRYYVRDSITTPHANVPWRSICGSHDWSKFTPDPIEVINVAVPR